MTLKFNFGFRQRSIFNSVNDVDCVDKWIYVLVLLKYFLAPNNKMHELNIIFCHANNQRCLLNEKWEILAHLVSGRAIFFIFVMENRLIKVTTIVL